MPKLVRLYIKNVLIGFAVAAVFVGLLLGANVMGLGTLARGSGDGLLAVFLLWFLHGIVFAGVQFGWAIMSMAERDSGGTGGRRQWLRAMAPVRIASEKPRRPF